MISKEISNIIVPYDHVYYYVNYTVTASDENDAYTKLQMAVKVDEVNVKGSDKNAEFAVPSLEDVKELDSYSESSKKYGFVAILYTTISDIKLINGNFQNGCLLTVDNKDLDKILTDFLAAYKNRMEKVYKSLNPDGENVVANIISYTTKELTDSKVVLEDRRDLAIFRKKHSYSMKIKVKAEIMKC